MLTLGAIHAFSPTPQHDGVFLAMSIVPNGSDGVTVWLGSVHALALGMAPVDIQASDYLQLTQRDFTCWSDVWESASAPEYADLVRQLRTQVEYGGSCIAR